MIANIENQSGGSAPQKPTPASSRPCNRVTDDFQKLVLLIALYSDADNRLARLEADLNQRVLDLVDAEIRDYAALQKTVLETAASLEAIARRHPDWFASGKTLKTPYGSVALKCNPPRLDVPDEEQSIDLLFLAHDKPAGFDRWRYLRLHTELNLEALAELSDSQLARFKIQRRQTDTFTVKPAKLDLAKAVKSTAL